MRGVGFIALLTLLSGVATSTLVKRPLSRRLEDRHSGGGSKIVIEILNHNEEEVRAADPCDCHTPPSPCVCEESTTTPEPCVCEDTTTPTPCDCGEDSTSTPTAELCPSPLINGGFEEPVVETSESVALDRVPGWQPTNFTFGGTFTFFASGVNGVTAFEGNQYAQLGGEVNFYQDDEVVAGTYAWRIGHRGKDGVRTVHFEVLEVDQGVTGDVLVSEYLTTSVQWVRYSGTLDVTQPGILRVRISTASAPSEYSFIDGVFFGPKDSCKEFDTRTV